MMDNITQIFDDYARMQDQHFSELSGSANIDINRQNFERSQSFEILKNSLHDLLKKIHLEGGEDHGETVIFCQKRIETILKKDREISNRIHEVKGELKKQMAKMANGKKVLNAYKQTTGHR